MAECSTGSSSSREKSDVWNFFEKSGPKVVTCKLCAKEYAYHGGTSNLREHLTCIHPNEFKPEKHKQQPSLDGFLSRSKCPASRAKRITELVVDMVARDLRPAAIVNGEGFQALLNYIEPGYKVPTDTHIAQAVRQKHDTSKKALKKQLNQESSFIALTSDIWTSCANDAYISLTAHFINNEWKMVSCVLATSPFPGHHTALNIVEKLKEIIASYGLQESQLVALVHDQGSNMRLSGEMMEEEMDCESLCCAAHRLQLCVQEGLSVSAISKAVGAAKKLVGHFRHSALASNELKKRQEEMGKPPKKLQQDCPTRWNSTFYMIKSLLENRWPVTAVLSDETVTKRQHRYLDLSSENWLILEELSKVLEPLEVATVFLSSDNNISLSTVLPVVHGLINQLDSDGDDSLSVKNFKEKVVTGLKQRWELDSISTTKVSVIATALDPRFKQLKFLSEDEKEEVKAELVRRAAVLETSIPVHVQSDDSTTPPPPKKSKSALDILLGEDEASSSDGGIEAELTQYNMDKPVPRDTNPMDWWRENNTRFPKLAQIAKFVLCIPATSTPSEQLFSTAGLTVSKLRSCLKPENVDALIFLNANYHYLKLKQ